MKNKVISLVLAIAFLISMPAFAYANTSASSDANGNEMANIQSVQSSNDSVKKFNIYSNLNGYYPNDDELVFAISNLTSNSATLSWSGNALLLSYTVKQFNVLNDSWVDYGTTDCQSINLKNLSPSTKHQFAIFSTATGELLGEISFKTLAKPKPQPKKAVEQPYKLVDMGVPKVSGKCKTFAYYKAVTVKSSPAYKVLNSGTYKGTTFKTYTDEETGIRMVDDCYCAALGTYYGTEKGTKYKITLSTGKTFKIILCDSKANCHTDKNNQYAVKNKDVVEFYIEKGKKPKNVRGSYNVLDKFKGNIVKIEKIVYTK